MLKSMIEGLWAEFLPFDLPIGNQLWCVWIVEPWVAALDPDRVVGNRPNLVLIFVYSPKPLRATDVKKRAWKINETKRLILRAIRHAPDDMVFELQVARTGREESVIGASDLRDLIANRPV